MKTRRIYATGLLVLSCSCLVGCNLLREVENREMVPQFETAKMRENVSPLNERELCVQTAQKLAAKGHATEAIKLYEKAERLESNDQSYDLELASLFAQKGDSNTAVGRYEKAIANGHTNASTFNNLAWTLMDMGQADEALETVKRGLAVASDDERLRATQAVILHHKGDRENALSNFEAIYGPSAAHHNMAILDLEAGQIDAAVEHAKLSAEYPDCSRESLALRDALLSKVSEK